MHTPPDSVYIPGLGPHPRTQSDLPDPDAEDRKVNSSGNSAVGVDGQKAAATIPDAYILEYCAGTEYRSVTSNNINTLNENSKFKKTCLTSAEELRTSIANYADTNGVERKETVQGAELKNDPTRPRRLLVVQELTTEYRDVLLKSPELDIDPHFIDVHLMKKSYKPLGHRHRLRTRDAERAFVHFEYPELVVDAFTRGTSYRPRGEGLIQEPPLFPLPGLNVDAIFCRASLWAGSEIDGTCMSELRNPCRFLSRTNWYGDKSCCWTGLCGKSLLCVTGKHHML